MSVHQVHLGICATASKNVWLMLRSKARLWWSTACHAWRVKIGKFCAFLDKSVSTGNIKFVVLDNPSLDETSLKFRIMFADQERKVIKQRTKMSLARIQAEIAEKGSYVTKSGRTISKLGATDTTEASLAGNAANARKALVYATQLENLFKAFVKQDMSYREMASELNKIGILTPRKAADPDTLKAFKWHASSTRNYVKRLIKAGVISSNK